MLRKSKDVPASCLTQLPCEYTGPTPNWTGPESPLSLTSNPLANLLCELFAEASKRDSKTIKMTLDAGQITTKIEANDDWATLPNQRDDLWTPIVFMLPKISSIESCQGVMKDPASDNKWRFNFTKENNQVMLSKIESTERNKKPITSK
jgi:hypothetical protein